MGQTQMGSVGKMDSKLEVLYIVDRGGMSYERVHILARKLLGQRKFRVRFQ